MPSKGFEIGAVVTALAVVGSGAVYIGKLDGRVDAVEKRIDLLERKTFTTTGVRRGELCMKLLDQQERAESFTDKMEIVGQLERFHCFEGVPASTGNSEAEADQARAREGAEKGAIVRNAAGE